LLIGYLHKLISRDMYHQIHTVFLLYWVLLPRWEALRQMRAKVQTLTNQTVVEKRTVFGQPVFGLNAREIIKDVSSYHLIIQGQLRVL
jgi:fumarate reductase subunit D